MRRKDKRFIGLFFVVTILVVIFAFIVILKSIENILKTSDFFKIKNILVNGAESTKIDFKQLKGINTFCIDLKKVSLDLNENHPSFFQISVRRRLPDELQINFKERVPLAKVKLFNKIFFVDEQKVLININPSASIQDDLPFINGLENSIKKAQVGKPQDSQELESALGLIKNIKSTPNLREYKIQTINAPNLDNLSFFIAGLEVKIPAQDYKTRLNILTGLLEKLKDKLGTVKYIDLRFRDPIVKMKDKIK